VQRAMLKYPEKMKQTHQTNPSGSEKRVKTYKMVRREQLRIWKYLYNKVLHENTLRSIM
jgi:hypothetical protein